MMMMMMLSLMFLLLIMPMIDQGEVGLSSAGMFLVVSSASLLLIFYFISAMTILITIGLAGASRCNHQDYSPLFSFLPHHHSLAGYPCVPLFRLLDRLQVQQRR
jgi:hypothetical protein